ncbi:hypothetical protein G5V57_31300 [Nordella sp. HKS 07]|uniref:hypothetical protein n=1 Tax=Nordella sp. HKS 07 TaxID=2712222 RepID=UPI0013E14D49|nr:hypothetical protein [Nordella sp. HKS 07]QIG51803.1 hypothetical protein G5V57_31300 [Nordella sp. HKS 07]
MSKLLSAGVLGVLALSGSPNLSAQTPDQDRERERSYLKALAIEVRELEECQFVLLVKDSSAQRDQIMERLSASYDQKSEALTNAIEGFITKYATVQGSTAPRRHDESLASFRYRIWSFSLRAGNAKYRKTLTVAACSAMVSLL